jgi:predicted RNase H-like nuclease (RuvC/YqgF family)
MPRVFVAVAVGLAIAPLADAARRARAQDMPGIEICTRESRLDRRTSCLQSNVEFLQQALAKNAREAQQKLAATDRDIAALQAQLEAANRDVSALKDALAAIRVRLDQLGKASPPPRAP